MVVVAVLLVDGQLMQIIVERALIPFRVWGPGSAHKKIVNLDLME